MSTANHYIPTTDDKITKLRAAQYRADRALHALTDALIGAKRALHAAQAAFEHAGVEDAELTAAVRAQVKALADINDPAIEALELARDCCDSLAGDLKLEADAAAHAEPCGRADCRMCKPQGRVVPACCPACGNPDCPKVSPTPFFRECQADVADRERAAAADRSERDESGKMRGGY